MHGIEAGDTLEQSASAASEEADDRLAVQYKVSVFQALEFEKKNNN